MNPRRSAAWGFLLIGVRAIGATVGTTGLLLAAAYHYGKRCERLSRLLT